MGMLFRALAPKPLKQARRAMHPVSSLTPRSVRRAKMTAVSAANPAGAAKRRAKTEVVRGVRSGHPTRTTGRTAEQDHVASKTGSEPGIGSTIFGGMFVWFAIAAILRAVGVQEVLADIWPVLLAAPVLLLVLVGRALGKSS